MVGRRWLVSAAFAVAVLSSTARAEPFLAEETDLEAAFVYNFAKFIEWPAPKASRETLVIGVFGTGAMEGALQRLVTKGRPMEVRSLRNLQGIRDCHIIFVGASEAARLTDILEEAVQGNVLAVSDIDRFAEQGGMIGFERRDARMRFDVNAGAASRAGLKISSQLLKIAHEVIN